MSCKTNDVSSNDVVIIEGHKWVKETPCPTIVRDASLYTLYSSSTGPVLETSFANGYRTFAAYHEGWGDGSKYRKKQLMPNTIQGWRYEHLSFDPEAFMPFLTDIKIRRDRVDWLPDVTGGPGIVVRSNVKEIICDLDPDMHYFFPMKILDRENDTVISEDYYHWLPRRRLWMKQSPSDVKKRLVMGFPGAFSSPYTAWELKNNQNLRSFLETLPIWGRGFSALSATFSPSVFRTLKSEGVTGLVENTFDHSFDRKYYQNIGHF